MICFTSIKVRLTWIAFTLLGASVLWAAAGSLSGVLKDPSGAVIPAGKLTLVNIGTRAEFTAVSDCRGLYSFPALPVGKYDLTIEATGFKPEKKTNIAIDTDAAVALDVQLTVGVLSESVTVIATETNVQTQPDTVATHLGEVVNEQQIQAVPLNGRSYTDLLAIQPGVTPITTLTPTSIIMAGVTGTINPSGDLNPGDLSIDGQRESANGFMVNSIDVQEGMNGGTSVIPNLDSIQEFRVLTNNFDTEYGNYNGGMVNVITRSGSSEFHGSAFEFLRNTDLDARNFFDVQRGLYQQNQPGGTIGGPILKNRLFFFLDFQHTQTTEGITSPVSTVMSNQERAGNFSDAESLLTGTVAGDFQASQLASNLGHKVSNGEPFYTPGCGSSSQCVFPGAVIPQSVWSPVAENLLNYIPPPNIGSNQFSTSNYPETVRDDKAGGRIDANTRAGTIFGYYFVDNYRLDNPYPAQQGGATVPGFDALTIGQAQEISIGDTKILSKTMVNEAHVGFLRNVNNIGQPHGGAGPNYTLRSQGFVTGPANGGIVVQAPEFEGIENLVFPDFVTGVPITNTDQWNNTLYLSDAISKVWGTHTLKFGGQYHTNQVNENPNATFNGTFSFLGTETGDPFADFLLGLPSNFTQTTGQRFYPRNRYGAAFVEDSFKARPNLTLNYGVRWELIEPWSERYGNIQTIIPGRQSVLFPNALPDLVVPGDPGVPPTLSPAKTHNFAPRVGVAYSPNFSNGILEKIFGQFGKSSIRASFGIFYTAFQGIDAGIMYGVPPWGYNYLSPAPPEFAQPFINSGNGQVNQDPYPFNFPPHGITRKNPYTGFNWASVIPISAAPEFYHRDQVPYTENYMFSIQRQIGHNALLTVSYAGNQGHHILVLQPTNNGNPALCLSLSQPSEVAPGSETCGPYGEDSQYTSASGQVYQGTRVGLGPNYGSITLQKTIGNSNYNALEADFRAAIGSHSTVLAGYTWSKSIDNASNLGEETNPFDLRLTRAISSWNIPQNVVITYTYYLPFEHFFGRNRLADGWSISGTSRFASGLPVTLVDFSDNSLLGSLGNGVNNYLLDTPEYVGGPLNLHRNPRSGQPVFNPNAFEVEPLGVLGDASRRSFQGPGISNFDVQLSKTIRLTETMTLDIRMEAFNVFNHAQFYGPQAVDGVDSDPDFGHAISADAPRLMQAAVKLHF